MDLRNFLFDQGFEIPRNLTERCDQLTIRLFISLEHPTLPQVLLLRCQWI